MSFSPMPERTSAWRRSASRDRASRRSAVDSAARRARDDAFFGKLFFTARRRACKIQLGEGLEIITLQRNKSGTLHLGQLLARDHRITHSDERRKQNTGRPGRHESNTRVRESDSTPEEEDEERDRSCAGR